MSWRDFGPDGPQTDEEWRQLEQSRERHNLAAWGLWAARAVKSIGA